MRISRPLENPHDLGNIRKPTVEDLKEYYKGDKDMPNIFHSPFVILSGDDGRRYIAIAEIEPARHWCYFKLVLLPDDIKDGHFPQSPVAAIDYDWREFGYREYEDRVVHWFPKEQDPDSLSGDDYIRFEMSTRGGRLTVYRKIPFYTFSLDMECTFLGTPFWYNKGNPAIIMENLGPSIGFEGLSSVKGEMFLQGRKVKLKGYGDVDSVYFHKGRETPSPWGLHDWLFFAGDEIYGVLLASYDFGYRDGGVNIYKEDKYLVPVDFKIEPVEYEVDYLRYDQKNKIPIKTEVEIKTLEGDLKMVCRAIGRYGYHDLFWHGSCEEIAYLISGSFTYNDGRVIELSNTVGWHEVYYQKT